MSVSYSTVTAKGQITLPITMRTALGIDAGQKVAMRQEGDAIVVGPAKSVAALRLKLRDEMARAGTLDGSVSSPAGWDAQARSRSESE